MGTAKIGFQLPERKKPGKEAFNTKPRKVETWVEALPRGNVGETARQVYNALRETNRLRLGWQDRQRLLEQFREPVGYVTGSLRNRFIGLSFPLPQRIQRIATLLTTLYTEMALGYMIASEEMMGRSFLFRDKRALTMMLHRAMRYLSQALLTSYQVYSPNPPETWRELHRIYRFAEAKRLHHHEVRDDEQQLAPRTSIATVYKQILLLALATPYRLRQGEVPAVYTALEKWAQSAVLDKFTPQSEEGETPLFVVHLDSDEEPVPMAFNRHACDDGLCRQIDAHRLTAMIHEELAAMEAGNASALGQKLEGKLSPDLMRRIAMTWGVPPKRSFDRSHKDEALEVVIGLSMLHRAVNMVAALRSERAAALHTQEEESLFNSRPHFTSRDVAAQSASNKRDVWKLFQPSMEYSQPKPKEESKEKAPELTIHHWQMRDESPSGYRLARNGEDISGLKVGELIGVRPGGDAKGFWKVGIIRWIRHTGEDELEMGIQVIAPKARAAAAQLHKDDGRLSDYHRILILPPTPQSHEAESLLVPIMVFNPGDQVQVTFEGQSFLLQLSNPLENTGAFTQFLFRRLEVPKPPAPQAEGTHPEGEPDFSSLWSEL